MKSKRSFKRFKYIKRKGGGSFTRKCGKGKIECSKDTINFGLCVKNPDTCNTLDYDPTNKDEIDLPEFCVDDVVEFADDVIRGKEKRYSPHNFIKPCSNAEQVTVIDNQTGDSVPNSFSIITMNAMGIYRGDDPIEMDQHNNYTGTNESLLLMSLRCKIVHDFLIKNKPDMVCFQEMSEAFFKFLYTPELKNVYPHFYENDLTTMKQRNKDIDVFILSKYRPKKISVVALAGNLDYTDSIGIYEFNNLVVVDVYLQAGSRASPGQKYFWQDFSRCRSQQLGYIKKQIAPFMNKGVIVLGDFNFDINSIDTEEESNWPEGTILKGLGLTDSWQSFHENPEPGSSKWKSGLTENTETNTLRYNSKLEPKMFRYDAIFSNSKIKVTDSKVVFNDGIPLRTTKENEAYESVIIPKSVKSNPKLRSKIIKNDSGGYDLFASDHFGVMSTFVYLKNRPIPRQSRRIRQMKNMNFVF
jgi:exonuclease III